jgi:hypothetical protein
MLEIGGQNREVIPDNDRPGAARFEAEGTQDNPVEALRRRSVLSADRDVGEHRRESTGVAAA